MFKKKMKQIGAMAMAASMILASVQLPPLAANAAENTNLALSATATASNSESGNGMLNSKLKGSERNEKMEKTDCIDIAHSICFEF